MRHLSLSLVLLLTISMTALALDLGSDLSLDHSFSVAEILNGGDTLVGKRLQVKGIIVDVCETRGCWIFLAGDRPFEKLRVKVKDGEIVFPLEARGRQATVEGILEKFDLSREEVIARKRHHAEERGESFDPASVTAGETFYQLRGLGARIADI